MMKAGGDKTASWVHMLNEDPPPPPPVEGTIIDAPMHFAQDPAPDALDETTAREMRHRRDRDRDVLSNEDSERRHRRRESRREGEGVSDGSSYDRRRSYAMPANGPGYDNNVKTFDGRPAMPSKRGSWFKKIAGL